MSDRWLNRDAVEWVLYESDVGPDNKFVLMAVATFTGADGRGAYPARSVLAVITGRSVRKVERDLAWLVKDGHLLMGDPRRVIHIRADRRPKVYDLPDGYRLWLASRGVSSSRRNSSHEASGRRPVDGHGASGTTERGVRNDVAGRQADAQRVLKELKNSDGAGAQPTAAPDAPPDNPARCHVCGNGTDSAYHRNVCQRWNAEAS